jgi:hypothetical protein
MTVYIFGYYSENNLGDDQFKYTIPIALKKIIKEFKTETFKFVNHQTIDEYIQIFKTTDTIVLGGGDVLTNFFLDKLHDIHTVSVTRLIAFCVGISYISELKHPILLEFESFYIRTFQDVVVMKKLFGDIITVIPDTSFLLPNILIEYQDCKCELQYQNLGDQCNIVIVCLNQHSIEQFPVSHFAKLLDDISNDYHIIFIPFCTGREDDSLIHSNIVNEMKSTNYTFYKKTCLLHTITLFKLAKYSIIMRFHALVFSYIWDINFLVITETRKTFNFCLDIQLDISKQITIEKLKKINGKDIKKMLTMNLERKIKYSDWVKMLT